MSDATGFYRACINRVTELVTVLEDLETISNRIVEDSSLAGRAATAAQAAGRADLTTASFDDMKAAIDQILFTFNSGAPTTRSKFYKLL